jgi:hypothetical protein
MQWKTASEITGMSRSDFPLQDPEMEGGERLGEVVFLAEPMSLVYLKTKPKTTSFVFSEAHESLIPPAVCREK